MTTPTIDAQTMAVHLEIRAAGGIVHSDGNIFFTNAAAFLKGAHGAIQALPPVVLLQYQAAIDADLAAAITRVRAEQAEPVEMSPEFTDTARAALLWVLWHHQGASSKVGQPIRFALGMGQHEHLNHHQVTEAKRWESLGTPITPPAAPAKLEPLTRDEIMHMAREVGLRRTNPGEGIEIVNLVRAVEAAHNAKMGGAG